MSDSVKTSHGLLAASVAYTYLVYWLTYPQDREEGKLGLEDIVEKTFNSPIELGSNNDTDYSIDVRKKTIGDYDKDRLEKIIKSKFAEDYDLNLLMTELCNRDVIPAGKYVVRVSW